MLSKKTAGFTLPEMVIAMAVGAVIMLGVAKFYPHLRQQSLAQARQYRLTQSIDLMVQQMSKDLQRAGFCAGVCTGDLLQLGAYPKEAAHSCVIMAYDLNRNGRIESAEQSDAEWFGYRLRAGSIEAQRGVANCSGAGWEKIIDQQEISITQFSLRLIKQPDRWLYAVINITGHWARWPTQRYQMERWIEVQNR